jgi:membrane protein
LTDGIWRVTEHEVSKRQFSFFTFLKTVYLCINRFGSDRLVNKASALTYRSLLAIVPILAIVFAFARGFGFSAFMENQFHDGFGGKSATTETLLRFVDSYLRETTDNGVFIGVGLMLLLWTVINLINSIESTFNGIWGIKNARSLYRKITDYFSMFLLGPILLVISGGLSLFISTMLKEMNDYALLTPLLRFLVKLIPFVLTWFIFTCLYLFMPNTKVKFRYAFMAGVFAGSLYQVFQYLYINSQLWVSRYDAVYGSFAAIPLLLLWLHVSWIICLFGVELTYAGQNIQNFSFDKDTRHISRRYRDFVALLIMSLIAKRFVDGGKLYTAQMISHEHRIPLRLTKHILYQLQEVNLLREVLNESTSEDTVFLPAVDINQLNVGLLLEKLDTYGSEDFKIDTEDSFHGQWQVLYRSRERYYKEASTILLKDL